MRHIGTVRALGWAHHTDSAMRAFLLVVLSAGLAVGCTSSRYDRYGRSYPASARAGSQGGQERYVICHKDRNTLTLPQSAVRAHLRHGDDFGACRRGDRRDDRYDRRDRRDDRRDDRRGGRRGRGRN